MSTPTVKELETVVAWLERNADRDHTSTLKEFLTETKADLSAAQAAQTRDLAFAKAYYETRPGRLFPWEADTRRCWNELSDADRLYHLGQAKPFKDAIEKAGWNQPRPTARMWDNLADVPTAVVVIDREGDKWENRGGKWGLGTGGNWGLSGLADSKNFGPFREYLG